MSQLALVIVFAGLYAILRWALAISDATAAFASGSGLAIAELLVSSMVAAPEPKQARLTRRLTVATHFAFVVVMLGNAALIIAFSYSGQVNLVRVTALCLTALVVVLVLSWWWRGTKVRALESREELTADFMLCCQQIVATGDCEDATRRCDDNIQTALERLAHVVNMSPWSDPLRRVLGPQSVAVSLFRYNEQSEGIDLEAMAFAGCGVAMDCLRDYLKGNYHPAIFDKVWFNEMNDSTKGEPDPIGAFRRKPDRRLHVSTVGAAFVTGKAFYSESPEKCRTFDSDYYNYLDGKFLELVKGPGGRHVKFLSMFTIPLFDQEYDIPIAVVGICCPRRSGFSVENRTLATNLCRFLGLAISIGAS